jgi:pyridinium-3,5-biscarboxylic acid mononucleotide synthase
VSEEFTLDWQRPARIGLSEAVLAAGKTLPQLQAILAEARSRAEPLLFTRLGPEAGLVLGEGNTGFDYDEASHTAIYRPVGAATSLTSTAIAVVTGGTSDSRVAREALRTLAFHGVAANLIQDVGVAGLWRLQQHLPLLREQQVLICAAGMDAALPTVLAGLVPALVIAVPTSTGYGRARNGETALNALLCSCAQGLTVVNIDNGFGAACAALRALRRPC